MDGQRNPSLPGRYALRDIHQPKLFKMVPSNVWVHSDLFRDLRSGHTLTIGSITGEEVHLAARRVSKRVSDCGYRRTKRGG